MLVRISSFPSSISFPEKFTKTLPSLTEKVCFASQRAFHALQSFFRELASLLLCGLLYPFGLFPPSSPKPTSPSPKLKTPILLIHGYLHNHSGWVFAKYQLSKANLGPIYTINLDSLTHDIPHFARQVQQKALEIEEETGIHSLILIGHSMGGLVSAYYNENLAPKGKITNLVTIGSPLSGTQIASYGLGRCAKQMQYQSRFLKTLSTQISHNDSTRYFHVLGKNDAVISPWHSAHGPQPTNPSLVLEGYGHISLLFSQRVCSQIVQWISQD